MRINPATFRDDDFPAADGGGATALQDTQPKPFITEIPLVEVFERLKRVKADVWQKDFCDRLQKATENRHEKGTRALIHAQPQLGKSVILAQAFPVWLLGHDPAHRFALATYNIKRSQRHAKVVIRMMLLPDYKDMFTNRLSHIPESTSPDNFFTFGRFELNDGQASFNPMGLQSGFVGSGADTLAMDDPYKNSDEAKSETIRENIEAFADEVADVRLTEYANWFGMFHRYHQADLAGYLLSKGEFDYWRYASEADGDYIDDETGLVYRDPLERKNGEFISTRFSAAYYEKQKKNPKTWYSQFQGKPTGEEGSTFNVKKIEILDPVTDAERIEEMRARCLHWARAWDNAATEEGGAYSAGVRMGIMPDEGILIDDVKRERVNTAERYDLQLETAEDDGFLVPVLVPQDPGSAGKDTAFQTKQMLENKRYTCYTEVVSGSKELRANPFSLAVNAGRAAVALTEPVRREFFKELKNFPLSTFKDQVDASSDAYRHLYRLLKSGTVIKNYKESRNDVDRLVFAAKYGEGVPANWKIYAACFISDDASKPSGAVIAAHAAENSGLKDTLFILDEFKQFSGDHYQIFNWIQKSGYRIPNVYLKTGAESIVNAARTKLKIPVSIFQGDDTDGIAELNWHFLPRNEPHPFNPGERAAGIYFLKEKDDSLLAARQESVLWKFNEKGEPQPFGGVVMNCVRMITFAFRTFAGRLTNEEREEKSLPATFRLDQINAQKDEITEQEYGQMLITRQVKLNIPKILGGKKKMQTGIGRFKK